MISMEYERDMRHMEYMKQREIQAMKYNKEDDMVNHPKHYNESGIECIDALTAFNHTYRVTLQSIYGDIDIRMV